LLLLCLTVRLRANRNLPAMPVHRASMRVCAPQANVILQVVRAFHETRCVLMNRFSARVLLLIFPSLWGYPAWAQSSAPHVEVTKAHNTGSAARIAPIARQQLFGSISVSTRSQEARKLVE